MIKNNGNILTLSFYFDNKPFMNDMPSLTARVKSLELDSEIIACSFMNNEPCFVLSENNVAYGKGGAITQLHDGMILSALFHDNILYTSGDDGKICSFDGLSSKILYENKGKWIEKLVVQNVNTLAFSIGKTVYLLEKGKVTKELTLNSSCGGLAFAPKGLRLAIAHYQGVTLWYPHMEVAPVFLEWKGSHLGVTFSPDGKYVVSTMQEPQLHGWRLTDGKDMRMSGYPLKVRSFDWTFAGGFLASSGAQEAILWPFSGKNGPMGEKPLMIAPSSNKDAHVSFVSSHPKAPVVAVGFSDGMITMARLPDGAEVLIRIPSADSISAIAWKKDGKALIFGADSGKAGYLEI
jgi:WD40 repeat protein